MSRNSYLQSVYGISEAEYDDLMIYQGGVCAICKKPPAENENLCVDHNHRSGSNRALLCKKCNIGLGMFCDSTQLLRRAIDYLMEFDGCPLSEQVGSKDFCSPSEQHLE